eukprot:9962632-Alexandrium_andersonii.AAC.1
MLHITVLRNRTTGARDIARTKLQWPRTTQAVHPASECNPTGSKNPKDLGKDRGLARKGQGKRVTG